jgi:hypothetical protein
MNSGSLHKPGTPAIKRIIERLEQKGCPQGLHVIAEELQWMGQRSTTYEELWHAVRTELRGDHPRIQRVAEGVYWLSATEIPLGWSLFGDRRMLPCFYRQYPPTISWEDLDLPENILPPPHEWGPTITIARRSLQAARRRSDRPVSSGSGREKSHPTKR